jgi:hypothetical protein
VVLLQNSIDVQIGERNEVIHGQLEGISDVTEEEIREPRRLPLTDPRVGFRWAFVSTVIKFQFP